MDSMIKTYGFRVSPTEIEEHARRFEGLLAAVAFGIDSPEVGQDLALAYTTTDQSPIALDALTDHFRIAMPHHMVPRWFVHMEAFPVTGNEGKIDRLLTRRLALEKLARLSSSEDHDQP
jgi:acyl-CoA synthetase (AMP-forming)/AMP-acid ligase II